MSNEDLKCETCHDTLYPDHLVENYIACRCSCELNQLIELGREDMPFRWWFWLIYETAGEEYFKAFKSEYSLP